jgi:hypothetical protein
VRWWPADNDVGREAEDTVGSHCQATTSKGIGDLVRSLVNFTVYELTVTL